MTNSLLGISISGLRVSQSALSTTGHNIANAGVDGYSRQRVESVTNPATLQGPGYVGNGVTVDSIERIADEFVSSQLRMDTSLYKGLDIYHDNISQLDRLLADSSTGLSSALESFFTSMQNGADDPTSIPARQLILSESENLSGRFNTIYDRFETINEGVDSSVRSVVTQVNALVTNIADLNLKVSEAIGEGNGSMPNDLLDQRDETIRKLSELIDMQTIDQGFGQINIVIAGGQNLVVGTESRELILQRSNQDPKKLDVVFHGGADDIQITDAISGGELGGLLRFQNTIMDTAFNELGRIAIVLSDTFNQIHQQGITLNNEFGGNFFSDINSQAAARHRVIGNSENAEPQDRIMSLNITDTQQLSVEDYIVSVERGGFFTIEKASDGREVANGILSGYYPQTVDFEGLELVFENGSFQEGDSFKLLPTQAGARDFSSSLVNASDIAFASPIVTDASLGNTGTGEITAGDILSTVDESGNLLPLFSNPGQLSPPLGVVFTSENSYDVMDFSDPSAPVQLDPPLRNQTYVVGTDSPIFPTIVGETQISTNGPNIGLPPGRFDYTTNGYFAEVITLTRPSPVTGEADISVNVITGQNASAKETASVLNNQPGVSANAFTQIELSNLRIIPATAPVQLTLNGENLIPYDGAIVAPEVPGTENEFYDYLAEQINDNAALSTLGIYASVVTNPQTGFQSIQVTAPEGDDLDISLTASAGESIDVSDGDNEALTLDPAGVTSVVVGGKMDVRLEDGLTLSTMPSNSPLFGDTNAASFAQSTYMGIQASLSGVPQEGDIFTMNFNHNAASDNRNALVLTHLELVETMDNGIASYADTYASLVEVIGIDTSATRINMDASEQVLEQTTAMRDSISSVNLDEEASNLLKFEQMYSANAQVISVARDLFDRLLSSF